MALFQRGRAGLPFLTAVGQRFDSLPFGVYKLLFVQQLFVPGMVFLFRCRIKDHRVERDLGTRVEILFLQSIQELEQPQVRRQDVHVNLLVERKHVLNVFRTGRLRRLRRRMHLHYAGRTTGLWVLFGPSLRCFLVDANQWNSE